MIYIRLSKVNISWSKSRSRNEMFQCNQNQGDKQRSPDRNLSNRKKTFTIAIHLPLPWYNIQMYVKYRITNFLTAFSVVSQIELLLYVFAYLCTFWFQLFQMSIHYWGHFRNTEISSTASFVFVFYFYHSIIISYVKLKALNTTLLNFYQWNAHYKHLYKNNKKRKL